MREGRGDDRIARAPRSPSRGPSRTARSVKRGRNAPAFVQQRLPYFVGRRPFESFANTASRGNSTSALPMGETSLVPVIIARNLHRADGGLAAPRGLGVNH